jgi:hypothetical protein
LKSPSDYLNVKSYGCTIIHLIIFTLLESHCHQMCDIAFVTTINNTPINICVHFYPSFSLLHRNGNLQYNNRLVEELPNQNLSLLVLTQLSVKKIASISHTHTHTHSCLYPFIICRHIDIYYVLHIIYMIKMCKPDQVTTSSLINIECKPLKTSLLIHREMFFIKF